MPLIHFAERHAERARAMAATENRTPNAGAELRKIADVCSHVPAEAPRDFHEALQSYWFCHLAVITELNGWDAFSPGHLDQHLWPFYQQGWRTAPDTRMPPKSCWKLSSSNSTITRLLPRSASPRRKAELTPTSPTSISAALLPDGSDGSNRTDAPAAGNHRRNALAATEQQSAALAQDSRRRAETRLAGRSPTATVSRPIFNADAVVEEQVRQGKTLEDARAGGCSGCVETGAFGKEAYILTGYFNLVKILELALHDGWDPRTGQQIGTLHRIGGPTARRLTSCLRPSVSSWSISWKSRSAAIN